MKQANEVTMKTSDSKMSTHPAKCYRLNGILYVPHYKKPGQFVGPGFVRSDPVIVRQRIVRAGTDTGHKIPEADLVLRGARSCAEYLWPRRGG